MWASRAEAEAEASKNFNHVFTWTDGPYVHDIIWWQYIDSHRAGTHIIHHISTPV